MSGWWRLGFKEEPGGIPEVLRIAWPLVVSMGSFTVMQFVDRMFLAWHSPISIQAALPAGILSFTLICGFMALSGYANTFVAQYHGAGDLAGCSKATAQGMWLGVLAWPILIALIPAGRWILSISGHAPEVLVEELEYFTILMVGSVVVPVGAAISSFFTGRGDTLTNMYAVIAGNVVNIGLDYVLIFGHFGFPAMGIRGAAYATIVGGMVPPILLFALFLGPQMNRIYRTRLHLGLDLALMKRMIRFGVPAGFHLALDIGSFSIFVLLTGRMGELALAASNIALSINTLAFLPLIGISIAATTLVGQYQGRGDADTAERAGWSSFKVGVGYVTAAGVLFVVFPSQMYSWFLSRDGSGFQLEELVGIGRWLLLMMAIWGALDVGNLVLAGALKGAGDTRFVMIYSVVAAWGIMVPGSLMIAVWLDLGILWIWGWVMVYIMLLAIGFIWRFKVGRWKEIKVIEAPAVLPAIPTTGAEALMAGEQ
ncbi:MAG TPA: MATE family efflux transporter [Kiritimatiellia bacterium]|nr:MATE family efflux transporter [Kiritimatiellia bacterium]